MPSIAKEPTLRLLRATAAAALLVLTCCLCLWLLGPRLSSKQRPQKQNIIFMVTDGMGPASLSLARLFRQHRDALAINDTLTLDRYLVGSSRTRSSNSLVTDSAAGATAFACALKSYNGAIGVDAHTQPCGTILEALKAEGYLTGLVVTTRITDATPASFSAHVDSRAQEDLIAEHQLGHYPLGRNVDLILGGGRCHFLPRLDGGCRSDSRNLVAEATAANWTYVGGRALFDRLHPDVQLPVLGLLASTDIPYDIDRDEQAYPLLHEQVSAALAILEKQSRHSDKGFFLLVEGLRIDHAGHHNDPAAQVREVLAYDRAFAEVVKFIDSTKTPTVAISTSDHETGGLVTARQVNDNYPDYLWYPDVLLNCTHSGEYLAAKLTQHQLSDTAFRRFAESVVAHDMGVVPEQAEIDAIVALRHQSEKLLYFLNNMISVRSQTGWTTHGHSAVDVNIYAHTNSEYIRAALAEGDYRLAGNHENTEIGAFMEHIARVDLELVTTKLKGTHHSPGAAAMAHDSMHRGI